MAEAHVLGPHAARDRRSLVTPEGVDLSLGLATGSQRVGAFIVDLLIMVMALIVLTLIAVFSAIGFSASGGGEWVLEFVGVLWLLGFFLIRNFDFILFEAGTRAATWGKRAFGLRVVARSGERLTSESVVARNLMREVELYLPLSYLIYALVETDSGDALLAWGGVLWVLLFTLFPFFNKDRLRVGDLLAGTWVVNIPKRNLSYDLVAHAPPVEAGGQFTKEQLDAYGVYELQTLEQVLRDGQPDTMRLVAGTIREKIGYWGPGEDYEFLSAYYRESRAYMERGLLFGKRRADKHDR
ncbi:MAG TPA: RDD family protein [Allosphingosinicella sp.]